MNNFVDSIAGKILLLFFPTVITVCILSLIVYVVALEVKKVLRLWLRLKRKDRRKDVVERAKKLLEARKKRLRLKKQQKKIASGRYKRWIKIREAKDPRE